MSKSIGFLAGGVDGCALWRFWMPYLNLENSGYYYQFDPKQFLTHDYVAVQRLGMQDNLTAMKSLRSADMKIIYDTDDFLWDIPDWNPHAEMLRKVRFGYSVCLHHADVVTVSTYPLKKAIQRYHKRDLINMVTGREIPIVVCPNRIDLRVVADRQERDELIVGWAGSNTHDRDFRIALPAIKQIAQEFPNVIFEFAGWIPPELENLPNVRFRHWTPVSEYMRRYPRWGWSIALAPLESHLFNSSKSGIKMCEAGAIGIPCLASWEPPYSDFVKTGDEQLKWLLCSTESQWYAKLKLLLEDAERRKSLGLLMRQNVEQHHSWKDGNREWDTVFTHLEQST